MWRTPEGLFGIPDIEQVGVGLLTALVAISLAVGCAHVLTGRTWRGDRRGFGWVPGYFAYWIFLRPPVVGFPIFAVAYAMLPVLILGLLSRARAMAARPPRTVEPSAEPAKASPARDMLVE